MESPYNYGYWYTIDMQWFDSLSPEEREAERNRMDEKMKIVQREARDAYIEWKNNDDFN